MKIKGVPLLEMAKGLHGQYRSNGIYELENHEMEWESFRPLLRLRTFTPLTILSTRDR